MDKQLKKIIEEAISCLNWTVITDNYKDYERIAGGKKKKFTATSIKSDLRNLCKFIIENNISYFDQDQFIITWKHNDNDKLGSKLEILYVPTRACAFTSEDYTVNQDDEFDSIQVELETLQKVLTGAVKEENYELAAIIRDRMNVVKKEIA